jgi:hypothetical protein
MVVNSNHFLFDYLMDLALSYSGFQITKPQAGEAFCRGEAFRRKISTLTRKYRKECFALTKNNSLGEA